jgi:radical SAM superfamily enzyme YgiQ (UPF0313 family)
VRAPGNNPLFRPPAEADSLILQVDRGCPYNRCTFCGMYKGMTYRRLAIEETAALIAREARHAGPEVRRVFLADGDVMRRPFDELAAILDQLAQAFPALARVNVYATGRGIAEKSDAQLRDLRARRLHTLYLGLESGDDEVLRQVRKGEDAAGMAAAGRRAQECGLRISVMILLGLGGAARTSGHADATARALNAMQPRLLAALRVVPVPGTELFEDARAGRFRELTERQVVAELRRIVAGLELHNTVFRADHSSNVVPLEARLPRDKTRLLAELDALLSSDVLDARTPGARPMWL